jgi:hypothetical protein
VTRCDAQHQSKPRRVAHWYGQPSRHAMAHRAPGVSERWRNRNRRYQTGDVSTINFPLILI